ncbi:MAG: cobalt-precorrin 5A hydrolase [Pseudobutyrivibrio sp.]|nr:cobalt-precorrin 5A hydrolase [Pseudobutyrivibrio sp.]
MLIQVIYFTENGNRIFEKLKQSAPNHVFEKCDGLEGAFKYHLPIVFIGATGIAVRQISPFINDKLTDSPVIVIDELGHFVISILSGHVGGANALAKELAECLEATPVITTATDINNVFAIDVFAEKNGLRILDKKYIKTVSSKLLKKETIIIKCEIDADFEGDMPENVKLVTEGDNFDVLITDSALEMDCLVLVPKRTILGMGCKKDKGFEELLEFVKKHVPIEDLQKDIYALTSIDVKAKEKGLLTLASYLDTFFITFSADELNELSGDFSSSAFVKETVGVDSVSERSAVALGGTLTAKKIAENGMTLAIAHRDLRSLVW